MLTKQKNQNNDSCFKILKQAEIIIPLGYVHGTQLSLPPPKNLFKNSSSLTDENFKKVSYRLIPGSKYIVKTFEIIKKISGDSCIEFLLKQEALFISAQGISLLQKICKGIFPKNKWVLSFDKKSALCKDIDGDHLIPCMKRSLYKTWFFDCCIYELERDPREDCLLCVCSK
ncbi:MAG: hypothetical protein EHM58_01315 [Ignavibacteriae bacterium]|nr:MAG: hypothetical protein EHM58_01315 [Ignavibacteriota bacterium]